MTHTLRNMEGGEDGIRGRKKEGERQKDIKIRIHK